MTTAQQRLLLIIPVAYVLGSIPFGLIVGLSRGIDPRKSGSGNIGATNLGRLLGGRFFALVFTLDMCKGLVPMLAAGFILSGHASDRQTYLLWLLIGFASIFGHMFSLFLKFKGGKGVATSAGVILGLFPYFTLPGLAATGVFLIVFKVTRYVSAASMLGATSFPLAYVVIGLLWQPAWPILGQQLPLLLFAVLVAAMIVMKHRSNISRLIKGTELRFGEKKQTTNEA